MQSDFNHSKQSIGKLLLDSGKIQAEDADKILNEQASSGLRFGDAAVKLGLLKKSELEEVLSKQFDFSYINDAEIEIDPMLVSAYQPFSRPVEQIRTLRGQLGIRWFDENKSIVIFGPESKVGTSTISANLAVSFAQLGKKTLLVDANMRNPSIQNLFKIENKRGLSDVLISRSEFEDAVYKCKRLDNLSILTAGATPPNPVELLGRPKLNDVVKQLENTYDVVIYDAPAATEHCDAHMLLSFIKGAVLVIRKNKSTVKHIEHVQKELAVNNAIAVGAILNEH